MARAIHPFPARMASEIALDAVDNATKRLRIIDPMCGSGTVLSHGVGHGHTVTGFDLDPLAVLMARTATQPIDAQATSAAAVNCLTSAERSRLRKGPWVDEETQEFVRYWFAEPQSRQLLRLSTAINALPASPERDALQVALSRLIVTKSPRASLAADTAHSRPHRVITESDYDVYRGFELSVRQVLRTLGARTLSGFAQVSHGDARHLANYSRASADLVVTSPPYLNAIDYLRGHRLALVWLGYSLAELRALRSTSIGSEARLKATTTAEHVDLVARLALPELPSKTQHLVERYALDMLQLAHNFEYCLVPSGRAVIVVADSVLRGVRIPTGKIIEEALATKGLEVTDVTTRDIPATLRYLPVNNAGPQLSGRMKQEYVITARKTERP